MILQEGVNLYFTILEGKFYNNNVAAVSIDYNFNTCFLCSMKAFKVFPGAEPNLKASLTRLAMNEDKLISAFSKLFSKLVFIGKEENTFEVSQVSC